MRETGSKARDCVPESVGRLPTAVVSGKAAGIGGDIAWLLDGMHSMAQPLTTLQARLQLVAIEAAPAAESYDRLLAGRGEIEQLCTLFGLMQEILQLECRPARSAMVPLPRVLATLVEDAEAAFCGYGIRLTVSESLGRNVTSPQVKVDLERTRKGWVTLFSLAREMVTGESELQCEVRLQGRCASITMIEANACERLQPKVPNGVTRLRLELAMRCIREVAQTPEIRIEPFYARIELELEANGHGDCPAEQPSIEHRPLPFPF